MKNILDVRHLAAELGFETSYDGQETRFPFARAYSYYGSGLTHSGKQTDVDRRFFETIGLRSAGNIGGEDWMLYNVMVRWGLSQEHFSEVSPWPDRHQTSHGDLLEYDINLDIFPRGKLSSNLYAQQIQSRVPRAFLPSLDLTTEKYGAGIFLNDAVFPMRFTFEHIWEELTSRTRDLNDDERRGGNTFRYEGTWQSSPNHSLNLAYEYGDRIERYSGTRTEYDTTRNYLTLTDTLRFGQDQRSSIESLIRYLDESGPIGRDNVEFSERLRLQLTKSLQANAAFQYLSDSYQLLHTETWRGELGVTHQLQDWLTTTAQFYGLQQQSEWNADACEWGALLNAALSKENALGRFSANVSYNHTSTTTRNNDRGGIVIGESVTLRDPLPGYLVHENVQPQSIVITDAKRTRTYLPVRDYIVLPIGRYTAIKRVATGMIADRETVLVTYTYEVLDNFTVNRDRLDIRVQQDFKFGLTPYYAGSFQNETTTAQPFLPYDPRNINRQRIGVTYRRPRWSVGAEYEYNDDSIDPYQALHANGDWLMIQNARSQLDAKVALSQYDFWGAHSGTFLNTTDPSYLPSRDTTLVDVGASYRYVLARDLELNSNAMYRFERDTSYGDTNGVDLSAAVDWRLGYFTLRFEAEYDMLDLPGAERTVGSNQQNLSFWLKLRRDIPIIEKGPPPANWGRDWGYWR